MKAVRFNFLPSEDLTEYFESIGMQNVVAASKGEERGVQDMIQDEPYKPVLRDLHRLHGLVRENRRMTVLEFGTGWSSLVLADALEKNRLDFSGETVGLRKCNQFEMHSLDDIRKWSNIAQKRVENHGLVNAHFHVSEVYAYDFQGRFTTRYKSLPKINPDFVYLDGPDQFEVHGEINGLSTNHKDFMPMASDILLFEHFLVPGTIIVVDGRGANARFLKANFQRGWSYEYDADYDQHLFLLDETPLGRHNAAQLKFYGE